MPEWDGILRTATEADVQDVLDFYLENPDKNVLGRAQAVKNACEDGRQFLVAIDDEIIGVSGAFPSGDPKYIEVGGTRVADSQQGFGLQTLLFWARFATIVLTEEPDVRITTAVDPGNSASRAGILKQGFVPWAEPVQALLAECDPGPGRAGCSKKASLPLGSKCCSEFFLLPQEALVSAIESFLSETRGATTIVRSRKKDGGVLRVEVACKSVIDPERREMLEAFCHG
jgi:hypothetical protein